MTSKPWKQRAVWKLGALGLALISLGACNRDDIAPVQASEPTAPPNPMEIKADETLLARIKTGELSWANVETTFSVAARVEEDDTRVTRVGSPVMGRIASLLVRPGQEVHHGQILATLTSTGLSEAQLGFLKAISQKQLTQRAVERAQILLKADVIGAAELQRRESELAQASAELDAARDQLALLGMAPEAIEELRRTRTMNSVSRILASMEGTVLKRLVTVGQVVQPADTVYEIADLSQVWLVADVPEQNAGNLYEGEPVEAQIAALPGRVIHGKLAFVSATVNQDTRTVMVRMDVPNPDRRLKPAMLATMLLKEHSERQQVLPVQAIVREENVECVMVQKAADTFVLREVQLGPEFRGNRVVLDGIRAGEKVVVEGAFHLNNERRRRAVRGTEGT